MTEVDIATALKQLCAGLPVDPLPPARHRDPTVPHAPVRVPHLNTQEQQVYNVVVLVVVVRVVCAMQNAPRKNKKRFS